MELLKKPKDLLAAIKKYRYVFLILLLGIVLMCMPTISQSTEDDRNQADDPIAQYSVADELAMILSKIEGVGETKVILSTFKGEEIIYQTDVNEITEENSGRSDSSTVIISDSDRAQKGLIRQTIPASYMGAIVVCEGADDPQVRLSIVDAIAKFTGLGANRISVLKMK